MPARIRIRPLASSEIDEIAVYLAGQGGLALGERFQAAVKDTFRMIAEFPDMGSPWESDDPTLQGIRYRLVQRFRNHVVFYSNVEGIVEVLHVTQGSRDLVNLLRNS